MNSTFFKNKKILITGGTGSFGKAMTTRLLKGLVKEIRIFSRDEKKQEDMRNAFKSKKIKFFIGDVKDAKSINSSNKKVLKNDRFMRVKSIFSARSDFIGSICFINPSHLI